MRMCLLLGKLRREVLKKGKSTCRGMRCMVADQGLGQHS